MSMHSIRAEQVASAAAEATDKLVSHCKISIDKLSVSNGYLCQSGGAAHMAVLQSRALTKWCLTHPFPLMHELARQDVMTEAM